MDSTQDVTNVNTNPTYIWDDAEANATMYDGKSRAYHEEMNESPNPEAQGIVLPLLIFEDLDQKTADETIKAKESPRKVSKKETSEMINQTKRTPEKNSATKDTPRKTTKNKAAKAKAFEGKAPTRQQQRKERDRELLDSSERSKEEVKAVEGHFNTGNRFSMLARSAEA
ncbi:hypothetical protein DOTSEDRAFT_25421 [Dothistroma septosporum NZE10]|uniref:Uncharacterized protein n=1 Tax=Dothistroma septosporum (strain NZE10 / CBS 128990) TaxID=675120 RepID=M2WN94_DOTSN|nr:hypothetical protein DOTSEDRAFT_25421 [Dothistroma septosporum NZE10]